jgi:hypothetical protein
LPAAVQQDKVAEEKKSNDPTRSTDNRGLVDDKLSALKNYRRVKGLCFTCGERWSREHKCHTTIQLHVVQEMIDMLRSSLDSSMELTESSDDMELMHIADVPLDDLALEHSIVLQCIVQGQPCRLLPKFARGYASISKPLTELLKKHTPFVWMSETSVAFNALKTALVSARVLSLPDFSRPFVIETDACDHGIGAVLLQQDHPLAYVGRGGGDHTQASQ